MSVERFVSAARAAFARAGLSTPSSLAYKCSVATSALAEAAERVGFDQVQMGGTVVQGVYHIFLMLEGTVVDFTLAQFERGEPWPYISSLAEAERRKILTSVQVGGHAVRGLHEGQRKWENLVASIVRGYHSSR